MPPAWRGRFTPRSGARCEYGADYDIHGTAVLLFATPFRQQRFIRVCAPVAFRRGGYVRGARQEGCCYAQQRIERMVMDRSKDGQAYRHVLFTRETPRCPAAMRLEQVSPYYPLHARPPVHASTAAQAIYAWCYTQSPEPRAVVCVWAKGARSVCEAGGGACGVVVVEGRVG